MADSARQRKELLISLSVYRTLSRVGSFLLRDRLDLRTARNGREIISQARNASPHAVVIEHQLTDLPAVAICEALSNPRPGTRRPLILITGPARRADIRDQCRAAGDCRYIGAWRSPERILDEIATALRIRPRRHRRLPAIIPIAVGKVASEFLGYSRDISEDGVLVESSLAVDRGRRLRLRMFLAPDAPPLVVESIVRRSVSGSEEDQHLLGMEFLDMDGTSDSRLMKYLEARAD